MMIHRMNRVAAGTCMALIALTQQTPAAPLSCAHAGPLACAARPVKNLKTEGCEQLRQCLTGREFFVGQTATDIQSCDEPLLASNASVSTYATVGGYLDIEGTAGDTLFGVFLFIKTPEGWCAADTLYEPWWAHGGYCKTRFSATSKQGKGKGTHTTITVNSEKICHTPIDQEEIAAGQSDVDSSQCVQVKYTATDKTLERLGEANYDEHCSFDK